MFAQPLVSKLQCKYNFCNLIDQNGKQVCSACGTKFPIDSKPSPSQAFIAHVGTNHKFAEEKPIQ